MASTFFKARLEGRALEHVVAGDTAPAVRMREESTGKWAAVKTQDAKAVLQYMRISSAIFGKQGEGGDGAAGGQGAHLQWWRCTRNLFDVGPSARMLRKYTTPRIKKWWFQFIWSPTCRHGLLHGWGCSLHFGSLRADAMHVKSESEIMS